MDGNFPNLDAAKEAAADPKKYDDDVSAVVMRLNKKYAMVNEDGKY